MIGYLITCYVIHLLMSQIQYLKNGKLTVGEVTMLILSPFTTPVAISMMLLGWFVDLNKAIITKSE